MLLHAHPFAASLLFALAFMAFAGPASAWRIAATIEQEGIGPSGPTEVEGSGFLPGDNIVSVAHTEGYPDNSEIAGHSSVHLAQGAMRGDAHTAAFASPNSQHQIRFVSVLEETLRITFPSTLPIADRIVHLRASVSAGFSSTNTASAAGHFSITVNGRSAGANFGTETPNGWSVPDPDAGWTAVGGDGAKFVYTPIAGERDLEIDVQLDGTASARGIFGVGNGLADVNAQNTAFLELILPAGATFTSGSGVFLTQPIPEPGTAALVLAGAGILAARGRRAHLLA